MTSRQYGSHRLPHGLVQITAALCSLGGLALGLPTPGGQATFEGLGFLHPSGAGPVIAYGISADGLVVVGQSNSTQGLQAFRWEAQTGIVGLGAFPNPGGLPSSQARACSADGSVIVGASVRPDSLNEDGSPFRWTAQTGLVWLGSLGGTSGGVARGVSSDGSVVVGYGSNASFALEAFRWTSAAMLGLGDLTGGVFNSQASAVSGDGARVIGLASTGPVYNTSFLWTAASGLVQMQPTDFRTIGISRDGVFAVGIRTGRAARVDINAGALLELPHVPIAGLNTDTDTAWAASQDGGVVVGMENLAQGLGFLGRAFVWDSQHGTRILRDVLVNDFGLANDLAGWELNAATCVSDDGLTLAGYGFAPSGQQAAWRVTLPDPGIPGVATCFGDGSAAACPCANSGLAGHGCDNSTATGGAQLDSSGTASLAGDSLVLSTAGELPTALGIFLQGNLEIAPAHFGDGLRCAGGALKRLYAKVAVAGSSSAPQPGDASISARSALLGDMIHAGEQRIYQVYYRDPVLGFCAAPAGDSWNVSNAVRVSWSQ